MANKAEYVELGLACADVCRALDRGMSGKKLEDLSQSVREAIGQLTTCVKPVVHSLDSLLTMVFVELWRRSEGRSANRTGGTQSLGFFKRGMIKIKLLLGSQTSAGFSRSSTYVQSFLLGRR